MAFRFYGSVSSGTLRARDLIPRFLDVLQEVYSPAWEQIAMMAFPVTEEEMGAESERAQWLLEELFDTLNEHAPEGYYFGAHWGDGADFGFWPCEDCYGDPDAEDES